VLTSHTTTAAFVDPAWDRIEGTQQIKEFLTDSTTGIEDSTFPDGRLQSGFATLVYASDGLLRHEEDVLTSDGRILTTDH